MNFKIFYFFLINVLHSTIFAQECSNQVHSECTHRSTFTTKEIQTAQLYLQRRFSVTNPIRPPCPICNDKPPCIRKDVKCLTETERKRLTNAWVKLYKNGVVGNFTKIHNNYWGAEHKFIEGLNWHYLFIRHFEKELQKIDPSICMPYWNAPQDFANPEQSIIFDIFGHSGTKANDYCITDGPFAGVKCTFPSKHCIRRQWRHRPTLDPWKGPEYHTMGMQMLTEEGILPVMLETYSSQATAEMNATIENLTKYASIITNSSLIPFGQFDFLYGILSHFDIHLSIGGYNGDLSITIAPCDPLFHLFHINLELYQLFFQLSNFDDYYLVPKSYNAGLKFDNKTNTIRWADIDSDTFNYYDNVYLKESFQFGYGDMCHLYDKLIEPINEIVNKNLLFERRYPNAIINDCVPDVTPSIWDVLLDKLLPSTTVTLPKRLLRPCNAGPLPIAAQRLKQSLNSTQFQRYYPKFANNNWTRFDHYFFDVNVCCNSEQNTCKKMPLSLPFQATPEGRRQYQMFTRDVADFDITPILNTYQIFFKRFMIDLDSSGYCSPYVTQ